MEHEHVFKDDTERYSRQIIYQRIGMPGQERLKKSCVLIVGCGGLGSGAAQILARAGIGCLRLVDRDYLELKDLQHQLLFDENDIREGLPKAIAAKRKLKKINASIKIEAHVEDVNRHTVEKLVENADLVMDGADNFGTRYLLNEVCVKNKIPWIYGDCSAGTGKTMNIIPGETPCFQCVFKPNEKAGRLPASEDVGIFGPVVNAIASLQCAEALKILSGNTNSINRTMRMLDLWENQYQEIDIHKANEQKNCPVCDYLQYNFLNGKYGTTYASVIGNNSVQLIPFEKKDLDLMEVAIQLAEYGDPLYNEFVLRLEVDAYELAVFRDGRALIKGTTDIAIARNIFTKYIVN